jgi:hypothetical protein
VSTLSVASSGFVGGEGVTTPTHAAAAYTVVNDGRVIGAHVENDNGVWLTDGGSVTNGAAADTAAQIEGWRGIEISGAAGTLTNYGTVTGGPPNAVYFAAGGVITNGSSTDTTAAIVGDAGVKLDGPGTVINYGAIEGLHGLAVQFGSSADVLVVEGGSQLVGSAFLDGGTLDLASGTGSIRSVAGGDVALAQSGPNSTFDKVGALVVAAPAKFALYGDGSIAAGIALDVDGTLNVTDSLSILGALSTSGVISGAGTLTLAGGTAAFNAGASLTVADVVMDSTASTATFGAAKLAYSRRWTQSNGDLVALGGDRVNFNGAGDAFAGTISGAGTVAFTGGSDTLSDLHLTVANPVINGASVTFSGVIGFSHVMTDASTDLTIAAGGALLGGGGALVLTDLATNTVQGGTLTNRNDYIKGAGQLGDGAMVLVNQKGGVIDGDDTTALVINTGANTITNAGRIEATSGGATTIESAIDNTRVLAAFAGTLTVDGAVSGAGVVEIDGGIADLASTFDEEVQFRGIGGGTLELAHSQSFTGKITGFSRLGGGTSLDLEDIPFVSGTTSASYSGTTTSGVLTVSEGTNVATIMLVGNYTKSKFTLSSDGHGGTTVIDPPAAVPAGDASSHRFIAAMAAMGAGGSAAHETPDAWRATAAPSLVAPRMT